MHLKKKKIISKKYNGLDEGFGYVPWKANISASILKDKIKESI